MGHDVIIIGGGPAGATAALLLARAGVSCVVLEKATFPRFHIGESLLPRNFPLIRDLGLEPAVRQLPHVPKLGVEFATGDGDACVSFEFDQGLLPGSETVNIERAGFDAVLLNAARDAGAEVREGVAVRRIERLADGDVIVEGSDGSYAGRYLLDASGQGTVVGRHLGTRKNSTHPHLQKAAYFEHFENVRRPEGVKAGHPLIVVCREGWFWLIPLDDRRTSVGLVIDPQVSRSLGVPADRLLAWAVARCPAVRERMRDARGPAVNRVASNFSYSCRPFAGPGYFLLGDAAAFVDPVFSTGVTLAMLAGQRAAELLIDVLRGRLSAARARRRYTRFVTGSTSVFFRLIREYYDPSFRELFLNGRGPLRVHSAVLSILAGHVFPRPPWSLRWRLALFYFLVRVNRYRQLVPPRRQFSLLEDAGEAAARWPSTVGPCSSAAGTASVPLPAE